MTSRFRFFQAAALVAGSSVLLVNSAQAQAPTLVACIGDSITQNSGWCEDLGTLLGADYQTQNFGVSGTTLLKMGDHPYWDTAQFTQSHDFNPNIVVIMLGTNDSKPQNWTYKDQFATDYAALIDSYRAVPSVASVYLNLPPPAGTNGFNISGTVIENEVVPLVRQVAMTKQTGLIDVFSAFGGHNFDPSLYGSAGDQVHPNGAGAQVIANTVYDALMAPPLVDAGAAGSAGQSAGGASGGQAGSASPGGSGGGGGASAGAGGVANPVNGGTAGVVASGGVATASGGGGTTGGTVATGGAAVAGSTSAGGNSGGSAGASSVASPNKSSCACNLRERTSGPALWLLVASLGIASRIRRKGRVAPRP
ncbi:MAG TPA: GDSL-type esterase/lipase family protein [Polyangiaceae bacterium]|nr:GDSL-type esterase/lipase family protein [Polyangiaceae bacterium]